MTQARTREESLQSTESSAGLLAGYKGGGEVNEKSRGEGLQRAVGDLLTCPWYIAPWVGSALAFGFVFKPRTTRFICIVFTAVTISDFLQHAYSAVKEKK